MLKTPGMNVSGPIRCLVDLSYSWSDVTKRGHVKILQQQWRFFKAFPKPQTHEKKCKEWFKQCI